jgi:hypothetical protein
MVLWPFAEEKSCPLLTYTNSKLDSSVVSCNFNWDFSYNLVKFHETFKH